MRSTFKVLFYLKKDKHKVQPVVPVMGRITVNGTIAQFSAKLSVPPHLWQVKGGEEPRVKASKPIVSTAIWIISVSR